MTQPDKQRIENAIWTLLQYEDDLCKMFDYNLYYQITESCNMLGMVRDEILKDIDE